MTLPTLQECQSALSNCLATSDESIQTWRQLIQRCCSHGTGYDDHLLSTSLTSPDADSNNAEVLASRSKEAGGVLSDSIEGYLRQRCGQRQQQNNPSDDAGDNTMKNEYAELQKQLKDDAVICAVVESLWLVGCLLDTEEDTISTRGEKGAIKVPYQCLVNTSLKTSLQLEIG